MRHLFRYSPIIYFEIKHKHSIACKHSIAWTDTLVSVYDANVYDTMGHVREKCKVLAWGVVGRSWSAIAPSR